MAKNIAIIGCIWIVFLGCGASVSNDTLNVRLPDVISNQESSDNLDGNSVTLPVAVPPSVNATPQEHISKIQEVYLSQLHVRELTGNNDGKDVEKYLASTGMSKGNPWCAAFVHWSLVQAQIPNSVTAWSPTAENRKHLIFKGRELFDEPIPGDVVTFFYPNLGRIGHTGFYNKRISEVTYESVEGNTNGAGSREGNGVYKKYRPFNSTYSISRWAKE